MFARSLWIPFGMSLDSFQLVTFARNVGSIISAPFDSVVDPPSSASENQWWTRPSAPFESQANKELGCISVIVLCSRCVPNCFAVVEYVDPTATGPSLDFVAARPCPPHSPCRVKSETYSNTRCAGAWIEI